MVKCIICEFSFSPGNFDSLATHFYEEAEKSDPKHVGWLNRTITKQKINSSALAPLLKSYFTVSNGSLNQWFKKRFIEKFYSKNPHPFVEALQHPSRATLLGYVFEHQHFLRQWVRSLSFIMAKTEYIDITLYELDNINVEFGGNRIHNQPAHYELLLQMGESLGINRQKILKTPPLPPTKHAIETWQFMAKNYHWLETMAAMHGLELIAHRDLRNDGAIKHYFNPEILNESSNTVTSETKAFLREGYDADIHHVEEAFKLIEKYSRILKITDEVQSAFLKSIEIFDSYLMSRLQRANDFEK